MNQQQRNFGSHNGTGGTSPNAKLTSPIFNEKVTVNDQETLEYMLYLKEATIKQLRGEGPAQTEVTSYYLPNSLFSALASSHRYEQLTLSVIVLNAIWIGVETEMNPAPQITQAHTIVIWIENFFCFYFTFEVLVRLLAFEYTCNCIRDFWFRFDSILVLLMVTETWLLPFFSRGNSGVGALATLRLLRLARLTRMVRIMRAVPELLTLIKGMVRAARSVASTLTLLVIFLYVFGLIFAMQYKDYIGTPDCQGCEIFATIGESMFVLFIGGTLLDELTSFTNTVRESQLPAMLIPWYLFVLLSSFTVLNMLIGFLCEVVTQTAESEVQKLTIHQVGQTMVEVFAEIDTDRSGMISQTEFDVMKRNEKVTAALELLAIQKSHLVALGDSMFGAGGEGEDKELSFTEFLEMAIHLRPENLATVLDVIEMRHVVSTYKKRLENKILDFEGVLASDFHEQYMRAAVGGNYGSGAAGNLASYSSGGNFANSSYSSGGTSNLASLKQQDQIATLQKQVQTLQSQLNTAQQQGFRVSPHVSPTHGGSPHSLIPSEMGTGVGGAIGGASPPSLSKSLLLPPHGSASSLNSQVLLSPWTNTQHLDQSRNEYISLERARAEVLNEQRKLAYLDTEWHKAKRELDDLKRIQEELDNNSKRQGFQKRIHNTIATLQATGRAFFGPGSGNSSTDRLENCKIRQSGSGRGSVTPGIAQHNSAPASLGGQSVKPGRDPWSPSFNAGNTAARE